MNRRARSERGPHEPEARIGNGVEISVVVAAHSGGELPVRREAPFVLKRGVMHVAIVAYNRRRVGVSMGTTSGEPLFIEKYNDIRKAEGLDFIPGETMVLPYRKFHGQAIVALSGDRAPFATSGMPLASRLRNHPSIALACSNPHIRLNLMSSL